MLIYNNIVSHSLQKLNTSFKRDDYEFLILYLLDTNVNARSFCVVVPCVENTSASYAETNEHNNVITVTMEVSITATGIINFSNIKMWGYLNTGGVYRTGTAPVVYGIYGIK